ncbi:hypothetical protein N9Z83_00265 [Akkermansiaceae bacterium]|nr:hypothetical protein [Akkermansiaceae bacterium]
MKTALFFSLVVMALVFTASPPVLTSRGAAQVARAINKAKQVSIALTEFESIYGQLPGEEIPSELQEVYPRQNRTDSNYILGQLIAAKILDSEKGFTIKGAELSDDIVSPSEEILKAGECQFSYLGAAGDTPINYKDFPAETPLLLAPMIPQSDLFDPTFYGNDGVAIYARLDSSVAKASVDPSGIAYVSRSKKVQLLDPNNEIWKGRPPKIHHHLPYRGVPSGNSLNQSRPWSRTQVIYTTALSLIVLSVAYYLFLRFKERTSQV